MVMMVGEGAEVVVLREGEFHHHPERVALVSTYLMGVLAILVLHIFIGLHYLQRYAMPSTFHRTYYLESIMGTVIFFSLVTCLLYTVFFYVVNRKGLNKRWSYIMTAIFLVIDLCFLLMFAAPPLVV